MEWLNQLVELVGFDILFLGLLMTLTFCVADAVWRGDPPGRFSFAVCGTRMCSLFRCAAEKLAPRSADADRPAEKQGMAGGARTAEVTTSRSQRVLEFAGIMVAAALSGMLVNLLADKLLDEPRAVGWVPPSCFAWQGDDGWPKPWKEEDALKWEALRDVGRLVTVPGVRTTIRNHTADEKASKAWFQHAYAAVHSAENGASVLTVLRYEFLAVKVLRVLLLVSVLLYLSAIASLIYAMLSPAAQSGRERDLWLLVVAWTVGIFIVSAILMWLWTAQSKRYYKKLAHAYIALCATKDGTLSEVPEPAVAPEYSDLGKVPGFIAYGEFKDRAADTGKVKMFEFSAAAWVAGKIIIADNETGKLKQPLNNTADDTEMALFTADVGDGVLSVRRDRSWRDAFARLGKKDYDDIEAAAVRENFLYLLCSHSRDSQGQPRAERHVFLRVTVDAAGNPVHIAPSVPLTDRIREALHALPLGDASSEEPASVDQLNIEGLALLGDQEALIGLRAPLVSGDNGKKHAIVLRVSKLDALFDQTDSAPEVSFYSPLDLDGRGIASLEWDPASDSLLVAAAPYAEEKRGDYSSLWKWQPHGGKEPIEIARFVGHKLEGIARLPADHPRRDLQNSLVLAFDEEAPAGLLNRRREQFGRIVIIRGDAFKSVAPQRR
jgi:hypothetical protein